MKEYNLADNLLHLRTNKGISQKEIAAFLGIGQAAYSKYETGQAYPKIPALIKLAKYYQTDLNNLVGFSPLSPYEKAVKHLKYVVPDIVIQKKDDGKIRCIVSRNSEHFSLKSTDIVVTEQELITCVNFADKEATRELQESYNDHFMFFFTMSMVNFRVKRYNNQAKMFDMQYSLVNEQKELEKLLKKMGTKSERKTRSDKKKDGEK